MKRTKALLNTYRKNCKTYWPLKHVWPLSKEMHFISIVIKKMIKR